MLNYKAFDIFLILPYNCKYNLIAFFAHKYSMPVVNLNKYTIGHSKIHTLPTKDISADPQNIFSSTERGRKFVLIMKIPIKYLMNKKYIQYNLLLCLLVLHLHSCAFRKVYLEHVAICLLII